MIRAFFQPGILKLLIIKVVNYAHLFLDNII
jgi:hypothetical protein